MKIDAQQIDKQLLTKLTSLYNKDKDQWSYKRKAGRSQMHNCFQYPAMMVPQLQGELINTIVKTVPQVKTLYEPFIGSGTVLTEAMKQGLNLKGQDINPLAILLCRTKSGPFFDVAIKDKIQELKSRIDEDTSTNIEASFPRLNKWFRHDVTVELSKIRRAIRKEKYQWCRRFFWTGLAETARQTSNSRQTTYKLHIRSDEDIQSRNISPVDKFICILESNLKGLLEKKEYLESKKLLKNGHYTGSIEINLKDSASENQLGENSFDLLVTSPPYGDNQTTISYGQYSYLPLQWIDLHDIDKSLCSDWLKTSYEIDRRSLGGSLSQKGIAEQSEEPLAASSSLRGFIESLQDEPENRRKKVMSFFIDFNRCIKPILNNLKPNAYMIWTVGNRRVANRSVPMDEIVIQMFENSNACLVAEFNRKIPSKRMALISGKQQTMSNETILVLRKSGD